MRGQFSHEEHPWGQTIERLDRVSRAMNPLLLLIAVTLVVLNLACVVNLINWSDPSPSPVAATGDGPSATTPLPKAPAANPAPHP